MKKSIHLYIKVPRLLMKTFDSFLQETPFCYNVYRRPAKNLGSIVIYSMLSELDCEDIISGFKTYVSKILAVIERATEDDSLSFSDYKIIRDNALNKLSEQEKIILRLTDDDYEEAGEEDSFDGWDNEDE